MGCVNINLFCVCMSYLEGNHTAQVNWFFSGGYTLREEIDFDACAIDLSLFEYTGNTHYSLYIFFT
jgi:hypothetical protein